MRHYRSSHVIPFVPQECGASPQRQTRHGRRNSGVDRPRAGLHVFGVCPYAAPLEDAERTDWPYPLSGLALKLLACRLDCPVLLRRRRLVYCQTALDRDPLSASKRGSYSFSMKFAGGLLYLNRESAPCEKPMPWRLRYIQLFTRKAVDLRYTNHTAPPLRQRSLPTAMLTTRALGSADATTHQNGALRPVHCTSRPRTPVQRDGKLPRPRLRQPTR